MANYPTTAFSPTTKNAGDTIAAGHVNDLQAEVTAVETALLTSGLAHHLLFVDATYDIGASGATRPRDLFLSRNATIGGTLGVTGAATLAGLSATTGQFSADVTLTRGSGNTVAAQLAQTGVATWALQNAATSGAFTITEVAVGNWVQIAKTTGAITITGAVTLAAHVAGTPTWVAGDKYLVVNSSGNVHVSAVGPAS